MRTNNIKLHSRRSRRSHQLHISGRFLHVSIKKIVICLMCIEMRQRRRRRRQRQLRQKKKFDIISLSHSVRAASSAAAQISGICCYVYVEIQRHSYDDKIKSHSHKPALANSHFPLPSVDGKYTLSINCM